MFKIKKSTRLVGAGVEFELLNNLLTFECRNPQLPEEGLCRLRRKEGCGGECK